MRLFVIGAKRAHGTGTATRKHDTEEPHPTRQVKMKAASRRRTEHAERRIRKVSTQASRSVSPVLKHN